MFADGMASIELAETFAIPILHDNYPEFEFAAMPAPREERDEIFYKAGGEGMVITKNCAHPEEAAEFVFWVMEPENLAVYAYQNGMIPANNEALEVDPFMSDPNWDIIRDYLSRAEIFVRPFNPNLVEFRDTVVAPTLMEVVEGKRTFAEANALIQEQATEMLNQGAAAIRQPALDGGGGDAGDEPRRRWARAKELPQRGHPLCLAGPGRGRAVALFPVSLLERNLAFLHQHRLGRRSGELRRAGELPDPLVGRGRGGKVLPGRGAGAFSGQRRRRRAVGDGPAHGPGLERAFSRPGPLSDGHPGADRRPDRHPGTDLAVDV